MQRDASSGHRRYRPEDVAMLGTLGNLRAVGLSITAISQASMTVSGTGTCSGWLETSADNGAT
jgi:DNA-binding transcriptional MerR regulator